MTGHKQLIGALLALLGGLPAVGHAEWVQAEGMAAMAAGSAAARPAAIQDALNQAGLTGIAQVQATDSLHRPVVDSTLTVRPAVVPKQYTILREWQADGLYHVLLRANIDATQTRALPAAAHKKTVAVARFFFVQPSQGDDLAAVDTGMAQEIARQLDRSGRYITHVSADTPFPVKNTEYTHDLDAAASPDRIKAIASRNESQFVITGHIWDAGAVKNLTPFLGHASSLNAGQGALFPLPFSDFAVGLARQPRQRRLEVEVLVYDGLSGALVGHHRLATQASGEVEVGRDKPFGSAAFYRTRYGVATAALLGPLVQAARQDIDCLPFTARIVSINHGRAIIDSGTTAGIRPGDKLTAYRQTPGAPVLGLNNEVLGWAEQPTATLVVQQVQPRFALGELSPGKNDIQPGDIVRAGS